MQHSNDFADLDAIDENPSTIIPLQDVYIPSHITAYSNEVFENKHLKKSQNLLSISKVSLISDDTKSFSDTTSKLSEQSSWTTSSFPFHSNISGLSTGSILAFLNSVTGIRALDHSSDEAAQELHVSQKRKQVDQYRNDSEVSNLLCRDEESLTRHSRSFSPGLTNDETSCEGWRCTSTRYDSKRRREIKNQREKERSSRISKQISDLRLLLPKDKHKCPRGTKSEILSETINYIRKLQNEQHRIM
jgi:hypothetical protein